MVLVQLRDVDGVAAECLLLECPVTVPVHALLTRLVRPTQP
jgi:hypothetical protein